MGTVALTLLVDNQADDPGLLVEHGLALWVGEREHRLLLDTGQGDALLPNARHLGIPLEQAEAIVLSHGHYDHTGALGAALDLAPAARLLAHPLCLCPRFSLHPGRPPKAIGMPDPATRAVEQTPAERITWVRAPIEIWPGVGVSGPIPRDTPFEDVGGPFFLDAQGARPDPIADDQALWIDTPDGLVVCLGCGHAGVVNTLRFLLRTTGAQRIRAVIGGMHLGAASERRLQETMTALRDLAPDLMVPSHCTGDRATAALVAAFGARVRPGHAGLHLDL